MWLSSPVPLRCPKFFTLLRRVPSPLSYELWSFPRGQISHLGKHFLISKNGVIPFQENIFLFKKIFSWIFLLCVQKPCSGKVFLGGKKIENYPVQENIYLFRKIFSWIFLLCGRIPCSGKNFLCGKKQEITLTRKIFPSLGKYFPGFSCYVDGYPV